jgi:hypothetical protein
MTCWMMSPKQIVNLATPAMIFKLLSRLELRNLTSTLLSSTRILCTMQRRLDPRIKCNLIREQCGDRRRQYYPTCSRIPQEGVSTATASP